MKKADITQALAEQAAEVTSVANSMRKKSPHLSPKAMQESINFRREAAAVHLAAINHINGVSPTQE